jgi:hypothetical protein
VCNGSGIDRNWQEDCTCWVCDGSGVRPARKVAA